ncbi:hypothetical protein VB773_22770 [Haloarculaceae archaeon H-GB2-1]|nr:hypothetical protein [Haloarculaceae archaeon H-GB2-1]
MTVGPARAAQTHVAIQSVNASVSDPAPGEQFTLTITVANLQSSSGPVEVTDVYVRRAGSTEEFARIDDVGTVAPGERCRFRCQFSSTSPAGSDSPLARSCKTVTATSSE